MIRERAHIFVKDMAGWNAAVEADAAANKVAVKHGWPTSTLWTLVSGPYMEIVFEYDYPDLNSYQSVNEALVADAEYMAAVKPLLDASVTERGWNELLMPVTNAG